MFLDLIKYHFRAVNAHGIHSPFVFDLYTNVFKDKSNPDVFEALESQRNYLKSSTEIISIQDFGAGSKVNSSSKRTVKDIAGKSLKSPFWSAFLYRIIKYYKHSEILELGTSLGVTTSYLAKAAPHGNIYTLEGCYETLIVAKRNFKHLDLKNTQTIQGNIDHTLPELLSTVDKLDFVLFDANHRFEPTIRYFEACIEKSHDKTVFIFDDIYWSEEMKSAWQKITQDQRVKISIDFYQMGLVFFNKGVEKQHFILNS